MSNPIVEIEKKQLQRTTFLEELFAYLQQYKHIVLKYLGETVQDWPIHSDVDILMEKQTLNDLDNWLSKRDNTLKISQIKLTDVTHYFIFFKDASFLQLDVLHALRRKELVYLKADELLERAELKGSLQSYNNQYLLEHVLCFNFLNYAAIPKKYCSFFQHLPSTEQANLLNFLNEKYNLQLTSFEDLDKFDVKIRQKIIHYLKKQPHNSLLQRFKHSIAYIKDVFLRFKQEKAIVITFTGVDGAGKSTVLQHIEMLLSKKYRKKTKVLRHRPTGFPILSSLKYGSQKAEQKAAERLPRKGTNRSILSSLARFVYYYLDYILGWLKINYYTKVKKTNLIFDRYYFDFIADERRANLLLPKGLAKNLYTLLYKPDVNILLTAATETILQRKQELSKEDIDNLTKKYQYLFVELTEKYPQSYENIANEDLTATLQKIEKILVDKM